MSNLVSAAAAARPGADITFTVFMVIAAVALLLTAVWLLVRYIDAPKGKKPGKIALIFIAAGAVIRLLCAAFIGGYRPETGKFLQAVDHFIERGPSGYYSAYGTDIYPIAFYLIAVFGGLGKLLGVPSGSAYLTLVIKLPFIAAEVGTAVVLYRIARRYRNSETGVIISALYSLLPVFFVFSGGWGSALCLAFPFILGSFYFLCEKKHFLALSLYAIAMLTAKEAVYIWPIYCVYYVYHFVRSIIALARSQKPFSDAIKDEELSLVYKLPVFFVGLFLAKYIVSLPLIISAYHGNPFTFIGKVFLAPLADFDYFAYNGLSIFALFGKNAEFVSSSFPKAVFTVCFAVLVFALAAIVYFSRKNRAVLPLIGAYVYFTLSTYFLGSTAVSLVPALVLLLFSFVYIRDRRLLQVFALNAVLAGTMILATMYNGGYLNMAAVSAADSAFTSGGGLALVIICALLAVASHLYLTLIAFDLTMSNTLRPLEGDRKISYFRGVGKLFR